MVGGQNAGRNIQGYWELWYDWLAMKIRLRFSGIFRLSNQMKCAASTLTGGQVLHLDWIILRGQFRKLQ
jgi:hypothetical protein